MGMRPTTFGTFESAKGYLKDLMSEMKELEKVDVPNYDVVDLLPLIDSSDMSPSDWVRIVETVEKGYNEYDGFVVVSGTDTLAYLARCPSCSRTWSGPSL